MIEAVLWDLGGVLCHFRPERRVAELARRSGCPRTIVDALLDRPLLDALDQGELDGAGLHARVRHQLDWDCSYDQLGTAWAAAFEPDHDVVRLAERVPRGSGLLTDNGPPLADQFGRLLPDVARIVPVAVFSSEVGELKPHPRTFLAACQRLGSRPEGVLFVDDNQANVDGAREVGLEAVQYTTIGALTTVLTAHGLLA